MKTFYTWYAVIVITIATIVNYTSLDSNRSYSSGGYSSYGSSSGGWHK